MIVLFYVESGEAREAFGGKLTADFIVEKLGHSDFSGKYSYKSFRDGLKVIIWFSKLCLC